MQLHDYERAVLNFLNIHPDGATMVTIGAQTGLGAHADAVLLNLNHRGYVATVGELASKKLDYSTLPMLEGISQPYEISAVTLSIWRITPQGEAALAT